MDNVTIKPLDAFKRTQHPSRPARPATKAADKQISDNNNGSRQGSVYVTGLTRLLAGVPVVHVTKICASGELLKYEGRTGLANCDGKNFPTIAELQPFMTRCCSDSGQFIEFIYALHTQSVPFGTLGIRNDVRSGYLLSSPFSQWSTFYAALLVVPWRKIGPSLPLPWPRFDAWLDHRKRTSKPSRWEHEALIDLEMPSDGVTPPYIYDPEDPWGDSEDHPDAAQEYAKDHANAVQDRAWEGLPEPQGGAWRTESPMPHNELTKASKGFEGDHRGEKWTPWHIYIGPVPLPILEHPGSWVFDYSETFLRCCGNDRRQDFELEVPLCDPYWGLIEWIEWCDALSDWCKLLRGRCERWFRLENRIGSVVLGDYREPWE